MIIAYPLGLNLIRLSFEVWLTRVFRPAWIRDHMTFWVLSKRLIQICYPSLAFALLVKCRIFWCSLYRVINYRDWTNGIWLGRNELLINSWFEHFVIVIRIWSHPRFRLKVRNKAFIIFQGLINFKLAFKNKLVNKIDLIKRNQR